MALSVVKSFKNKAQASISASQRITKGYLLHLRMRRRFRKSKACSKEKGVPRSKACSKEKGVPRTSYELKHIKSGLQIQQEAKSGAAKPCFYSPSTEDIEEFFAGFEQEQRKHANGMSTRYNFDFNGGIPLSGRFEWQKT